MFQFPALASTISADVGIASDGLPHSDIRGSRGICPSPRLFAACHVLRRLREPRHPPYALLPFRFIFMDGALHSRALDVCFAFLFPCRFPVGLRHGARCDLLLSFCLLACDRRSSCEAPVTASSMSLCSFQSAFTRCESCECYIVATKRPARPAGRLSASLVVSVCSSPQGCAATPPERRCSSRTFRYGYLVTT